jgi:hypothetical protein
MHTLSLFTALSYGFAQPPPQATPPEPCTSASDKVCEGSDCCGNAADISAKVISIAALPCCEGGGDASVTMKVRVEGSDYDVPLGSTKGLTFDEGDEITIKGSICKDGKIHAVSIAKGGESVTIEKAECPLKDSK